MSRLLWRQQQRQKQHGLADIPSLTLRHPSRPAQAMTWTRCRMVYPEVAVVLITFRLFLIVSRDFASTASFLVRSDVWSGHGQLAITTVTGRDRAAHSHGFPPLVHRKLCDPRVRRGGLLGMGGLQACQAGRGRCSYRASLPHLLNELPYPSSLLSICLGHEEPARNGDPKAPRTSLLRVLLSQVPHP